MSELVALLEDTLTFAADPRYVDTDDIYSVWESREELLAEIREHRDAARQGVADVPRLRLHYAPTAGLCEIATSEGVATYLSLAARFDRLVG